MSTEILKLAYDVCLTALTRQDANLASLRNRATTIVSVAAIGPSVAATVGLLNMDPSKGRIVPIWSTYVVLALILTLGVAAMGILLPVRKWHHLPNAAVYVYHFDKGTADDDFRKRVVLELDRAYEENQEALNRRAILLNVAIVILLALIVTLVVGAMQSGDASNVHSA